jgi:hypothetical protein
MSVAADNTADANITRSEAARRLGVSRDRLTRWEQDGHAHVQRVRGLPFYSAVEVERLEKLLVAGTLMRLPTQHGSHAHAERGHMHTRAQHARVHTHRQGRPAGRAQVILVPHPSTVAAQISLSSGAPHIPSWICEVFARRVSLHYPVIDVADAVSANDFCYLFKVVGPARSFWLNADNTQAALLKIGVSGQPELRCARILQELSYTAAKHSSAPFTRGELIAVVPGGRTVERMLHELFGAFAAPVLLGGTLSREFFWADPVMAVLSASNLLPPLAQP